MPDKYTKLKSLAKNWWFVLLYLFIYFIAINLVSLNRFWQFENFYFDHGIYDGSLWKAAHLITPLFDHIGNPSLHQLGDHSSFGMYLLVPLYWITSSYNTIFIVQNIFFIASAFILFLIAKSHIKNKLMVFALILSYTLFIGIQNALIAGFHPEIVALFTLSLALWAMDKKNWLLYWIFLILTLSFKETFVSIGMALGLYLLLKRNYKAGFLTVMYSLAYYFFAVKLAIPFFAGHPYGYGFTNYPLPEMAKQFFYPWIKSETMAVSFSTFGLLPFFGPAFLAVILQDFFGRFVLNSGTARWDLGMHYNAMLTPLLFYGSIEGIRYLQKIKWYKPLLAFHALLIILIVLFFHRVKYHGPLGLAYNKVFYTHTQDLDFLRRFLQAIPPGKTVMTLNSLAPQLTHSAWDVLLLRPQYWKLMPDMVVLDIRQGQNPNNYWPTLTQSIPDLYRHLSEDKNYDTKKITPEQVIFIKKEKVDMSIYPQK